MYDEIIKESGYADAFQVVMEALGIPCVTITGSVAGKGHAWNHVLVDGEWQYMDLTVYDINGFGILTSTDGEGRKSYPQEDYDLFKLTYKFY